MGTYQNNLELYADFEIDEKKCKKFAYKKVVGKKCSKLEPLLFYTTKTQKYLANNLLLVHFIPTTVLDPLLFYTSKTHKYLANNLLLVHFIPTT
jgi:energy-converting hydrogenase Eha subunit F